MCVATMDLVYSFFLTTLLRIVTRPKKPSHFTSGHFAGQALLMVVVAMVIVLSVSLSVATRSIVNVHTSVEESNSTVAFSAAEAGIEKYLQQTGTTYTYNGPIGDASVTVNTTPIGGSKTQLVLNGGNPVLKDDGVDLWLSSYPSYGAPYYTGTVRVYWNTTNACAGTPTEAAIEVILLSGPAAGTLTTPITTRYAADPCASRASQSNKFPSSSPTIIAGPHTVDGKPGFMHAMDVPMPAGNANGIIARIIPLYNNTIVGVSGPANFPQQGAVVSSTGSSGDAVRKITIYQGYPKVPNEFFSYTLFSPCDKTVPLCNL